MASATEYYRIDVDCGIRLDALSSFQAKGPMVQSRMRELPSFLGNIVCLVCEVGTASFLYMAAICFAPDTALAFTVYSGFRDEFAPDKWSFEQHLTNFIYPNLGRIGDGAIDFSNAPDSLTLTGSRNGSSGHVLTSVYKYFPDPGFVEFQRDGENFSAAENPLWFVLYSGGTNGWLSYGRPNHTYRGGDPVVPGEDRAITVYGGSYFGFAVHAVNSPGYSYFPVSSDKPRARSTISNFRFISCFSSSDNEGIFESVPGLGACPGYRLPGSDPPPVDTPAPLPLLGAAAAFRYSRILRKRIKRGKP